MKIPSRSNDAGVARASQGFTRRGPLPPPDADGIGASTTLEGSTHQKRKTAFALACAAVRRSGHGTGGRGASALEDANDLEQRLSEVTENLRGGYFTATSDLEARISELERTTLDNKGGMNVLFKSGLKNESDDKAFAYQFYGRIQNDWVFWDANRDIESALGAEINGGEEFRRVRLGANGTLYGNVKFKSEIDFAAGAVAYADVFMELTGCGFGNVRVGHFDEPFGLDRLTSSRFITFMERNLIEQSGMTPERNTGLMVHGNAADGALVYQLGVFRDANGAGDDIGGTPRWGVQRHRPRRRPPDRRGRRRDVPAPRPRVQHPRLQQRRGPVPRASEHPHRAAVRRSPARSRTSRTARLSASRPRTWPGRHGEGRVRHGLRQRRQRRGGLQLRRAGSRPRTGSPARDRVRQGQGRLRPPEGQAELRRRRRTGGWQIALGYDTIDLNDGAYTGGEMNTWRFGVNWWLNPNTRVTLNVVQIDQRTSARRPPPSGCASGRLLTPAPGRTARPGRCHPRRVLTGHLALQAGRVPTGAPRLRPRRFPNFTSTPGRVRPSRRLDPDPPSRCIFTSRSNQLRRLFTNPDGPGPPSPTLARQTPTV